MTLINNFDGLLNADNASGAPWFQVVKPADVATIPDVVLDQISTAITLNGGATAYNIMATVGTVQWSEVPQDVNGRLSYKSVFSFVIPKDRADVLNYAQHLNNRGVIAIVRDANGQNRLMGTIDEPATFKLSSRTLGNTEGQRNEHIYEISLVSPRPVPFYQVSSHLPAPANSCPAPPSLSIEVYSDAGYTVAASTFNLGATAYIKLTPTGITPTTYSFFFGNGTKNAPQVTQVGNTLAWVVSLTGTITISATATQGTDATADATPFTLTSTLVITKGISFDGVNDFAVTGLPKINSASEFSISFRFKMNSTSGRTSLYSFAAFNQSGRATQEMYYESNAFIFLSVNAYSFSQTLPWVGDTNSHVFTMRYNSTVNAVEIFIDGVSIGVCAQVVTAGGYIAGLWSLVLGRAFNFSSYGNVKMDDIRVFGHYLTTGEIATLQTAGAAVGNEVVWFPFALESVGTTSFATDIVTGYQLAMYNITAPNGIVSL